MSLFVNKEDYGSAIDENLLDDIIDFDDDLLNIAEQEGISEMKSYLNSRYDTAAVFGASGADRNPIVLRYLIDITLYHLHSRINPRKVPELRKDRYKKAMEWLMMVSEQKLNPDLPVPATGTKDYILYSSNPQRNHHI